MHRLNIEKCNPASSRDETLSANNPTNVRISGKKRFQNKPRASPRNNKQLKAANYAPPNPSSRTNIFSTPNNSSNPYS